LGWDKILSSRSKWMEGTGPAADIVLTSRIRLARNLDGRPFPHLMSPEQGTQVISEVTEALKRLPPGELGTFKVYNLSEMLPLQRMALVEKHLASPEHAKGDGQKALGLREDEAVSVMINEEDHIRLQCLYPGLQLDETWELATRLDDWLEKKLTYAFDEKKGYLTACPTNVGTGLRASVMMHLPALTMTDQAKRLFTAMSKLGLVVRGIYGEGTEAIGNLFQVSNQITLGQSEGEILNNLKSVARQIIEQERNAREMLLTGTRVELEDRVWRSYGILANARRISSEEAMRRLSDVRLGIDTGMIGDVSSRVLNELLVLTRPGYLQLLVGRKLNSAERDQKRAELIRERLKPSKR